MRKIAIVTDSNSGITQEQSRKLGIKVLPMPFYINEKLFYEDITLKQEDFYIKLEEDSNISTSQPTPEAVMQLWDELLNDFDEVVHIPMSSGLSGSCNTAIMLANDYDGKVQVVNNQRISVTQRQSVLDAIMLAKGGKSAFEIKNILEQTKHEASIYITVDTLKYLKKGGRITPAAAAIGSMLKIKPVLQIQGDKLDAYAKARGKIQAKKIMIDAIKKDLETKFSEPYANAEITMHAAYTGDYEEAIAWKNQLEEVFPNYSVHLDPLSLSVACHIGYGALAVACTCKVSV